MRAWRRLRSRSAEPRRRRCTSRRYHRRIVSPPWFWCERFLATDAIGEAYKSFEKRRDTMFEDTTCDRRRFLGATALTMAAAHLGMMGGAHAQPQKTKPSEVSTMKPHTNTSFGPVKQIEAGLLN